MLSFILKEWKSNAECGKMMNTKKNGINNPIRNKRDILRNIFMRFKIS